MIANLYIETSHGQAVDLSSKFGSEEEQPILGQFLDDYVDSGLLILDMLAARNDTIERNSRGCGKRGNQSQWKTEIQKVMKKLKFEVIGRNFRKISKTNDRNRKTKNRNPEIAKQKIEIQKVMKKFTKKF